MNTDSLWRPPFHWVIAAPLDIIQGRSMQAIQALLSDEERSRMGRFHRQCDQRRYALAQGLKRFCLSKIVNLEPASIPFRVGDKGKPFCDYPGAPQFNISHSGDWVLLGVSSIAAIGVDVEMASRGVSESVARYALTPEQLEEVNTDEKPAERFMLYWTQKEAISKALGLGLSIDFQTVKCNGQKQLSQLVQSGQVLTVSSQLIDDYVVSVASTVVEEPSLYRLVRWDSAELIVGALVSASEKA